MTLLLTFASVFTAGIPMFTFLAFVWWMDRYEREPIWLVLLTFGWGAVGSIVVAVIGSGMLSAVFAVAAGLAESLTGNDYAALLGASGPVLVAPLMEEPAKAVFLLAVFASRHFDNSTDGFVYGAAAGLGFGMTENFLYFLGETSDVASWGQVVIIRTLFSAVMHASASAMVGAILGAVAYRSKWWLIVAIPAGLFVAMSLHFMWNGLLVYAEMSDAGWAFFLDLILLPSIVALLFGVFQLCLLSESRMIHRELQSEVEQGRMPAHHPAILSSWFRTWWVQGWLSESINQNLYVQTATQLALRKNQLRLLGSRGSKYHEYEVERLTKQLSMFQHDPQPA